MAKKIRVGKTLKSCTEENLPTNIIASAVYINADMFVQHAGIFIRYNNISYLFHFTSTEVILERFEDVDEQDSYFFKELKFIKIKTIASFFHQCKLVERGTDPEYGYIHTPLSEYNEEGLFVNPHNFPEYTTCVGFCLNFLNHFLSDEDYFYYEDWDTESVNRGEGYIENFLNTKVKPNYPDLNIEEFIKNIRRILPVEYVSGAYSNILPVRKSFTDVVYPDVQKVLEKRMGTF